LDYLVNRYDHGASAVKKQIDGCWYYARPETVKGIGLFIDRLIQAFEVISGRAFAYHFYEDEKRK
jgi:hypothetical protein